MYSDVCDYYGVCCQLLEKMLTSSILFVVFGDGITSDMEIIKKIHKKWTIYFLEVKNKQFRKV